ncbi:hypothetical protein K439DRAFT_212101 [Ramaria rubella]|nr:hypothetical protein K439DRAFT_212101 [Ramaria rubella]
MGLHPFHSSEGTSLSLPVLMSALDTLLKEIRSSFEQLYATRYTQASSMGFILWDYILTLPFEVELFWTGKWSYPRLLFFLNRYLVIFWQVRSMGSCDFGSGRNMYYLDCTFDYVFQDLRTLRS